MQRGVLAQSIAPGHRVFACDGNISALIQDNNSGSA